MQHPTDGTAQDHVEELSIHLINVVDEVIELARLSSEQLFDGILVDLDPISREKLVSRTLPAPPTCEGIVSDMIEQVSNMKQNLITAQQGEGKSRLLDDNRELKSKYLQFRQLIPEKIEIEESEEMKKSLTAKSEAINDDMRDFVSKLIKIEEFSNNQLDKSMENLLKSLERLKRLFDGEEEYDLLDGSINRLNDVLRNLESAVKQGDKDEIVQQAKYAVTSIKSQAAESAQTIEQQQVDNTLKKLLQGTRMVMNNEGSTDLLSTALLECRDKVKDISINRTNILPIHQNIHAIHKINKIINHSLTPAVHNSPGYSPLQSQTEIQSNLATLEKNISNLIQESAENNTQNLDKNFDYYKKIHESNKENFINERNVQKLANYEEMQKKQGERLLGEIVSQIARRRGTEEDKKTFIYDLIIENSNFFDHYLGKFNDNLKSGRENEYFDNSIDVDTQLDKQVLLFNLLESQADLPIHSLAQFQQNLHELKKYQNQLVPQTENLLENLRNAENENEAEQARAKQAELEDSIAKIRKVNYSMLEAILEKENIKNKINDLNLKIEQDAEKINDKLQGHRVNPETVEEMRNLLISENENLIKQKLLAETIVHSPAVSKEDARNKEEIKKATNESQKLVNKLQITAADTLNQPNDPIAKNKLKKAVEINKTQSEKVASLVDPSVVDRFLHNGEEFRKESSNIMNSYESQGLDDDKNQFAVLRFKKQIKLANQIANQSNHPQMKLIMRKLIQFAEPVANQLAESIKNPHNPDQILADFNKLQQVNDKLMIAVRRIKEEEVNNKNKLDNADPSLAGAANQLLNASAYLDADQQTPKGKLYALLKNIANQMKDMSDAASNSDKRGIITSARSISTLTNDIVKIASSVHSNPQDKATKDEMMSMAHAAKNFSVVWLCFKSSFLLTLLFIHTSFYQPLPQQLKILAAVKTSSIESDPTTENQLVTCAKGLANSVIQVFISTSQS